MSKVIILIALFGVAVFAQQKGSFTDPRDKKTYKTVKIGEQTWMAENLNYNAKGSKCYGNKPANCDKYGRLYSWETSKSACPAGWHLPAREEWNVLYDAVGGEDIAEKVLKSKSGWNDDTEFISGSGRKISGNGEDKFGFAMLPGGAYGSCGDGVSSYAFLFAGSCGFFSNSNGNGYLHVCSISDGISSYMSGKDCGYSLFSVRCLKD